MSSVLSISDLRIETQDRTRCLVDGVSLAVQPGETLAIVGESGSGKSLTALASIGLLPAVLRQTSGEVRLRGADLSPVAERAWQDIRGRRIGMVFQEPMSAFSQVRTVGDQIGEPLVRHAGLSRRSARARAAELLAELDVPQADEVVNRYSFEFSGGMLQRAMIARAIACEPDVIIADEPTTALDVTVQAQVLALLKRVQNKAGSAMLFITHDLAVARQVADRVVVMRQGRLIEEGATARVLGAPRQPYTRALMQAVPRLQPVAGRSVSDDPILTMQDVALSYACTQPLFGRPKPARPVLKDISLAVERGSIMGLVGESGSGKTTLARAVLGLSSVQSGRISFLPRDGVQVHPQAMRPAARKTYWRRVQMVFQNPYASLNPWLSVEQILTEPLLNHRICGRDEVRARAAETLRSCGLEADCLSRFPHSFSGGQRQRIAIARALVTGPELVICDEPMSALDVTTQARIADLLRDLRDRLGLTFLIITHDLAAASQLCDRITVMRRGEIVETGPTAQVFAAPQDPYTAQLLAAVPTLDPPEAA
ncbi:ABC transporter ATP-binding protein [Mameliella alba]|nr:ABC transporter ATP-binding protein [Mameliella alba]MBY6171357.1 ABC transporter ATP-binding protein [Mameliella alba]MBY6176581.1 ABC transporter ATP-binding protein [Mameliella alba]